MGERRGEGRRWRVESHSAKVAIFLYGVDGRGEGVGGCCNDESKFSIYRIASMSFIHLCIINVYVCAIICVRL